MRHLAPVLAVGLVLGACGSGSSDDATVPPATTAPTTSAPADAARTESDSGSAVAPADVPDALQFSAPLVGGGDIELTTLAGRPVLLWFWAPW
jgi:hypothetical protein